MKKIKILDSWGRKGGFSFKETDLLPQDLERRLTAFHTPELKKSMQNSGWKKRCNTSHCFVGDKAVYKNGVPLFSKLTQAVPPIKSHLRKTYLEEVDKDIDALVDSYIGEMGYGKVLVQAGHFIPDLNDLRKSSLQSVKGLEDGLKLIKKLYEAGKSADLMIYVNDIRMMKGDVGEETRKSFYDKLILPDDYVELIEKYTNEIEGITKEQGKAYNLKILFSGEKKLYNRVLSESKKLFKAGKVKKEGSLYKTKSGIILADTSHGNPGLSQIKCDSACMRLNILAEEMGYSSLVNFYPTCAKKGIESRGMKAMQEIADVGIPIFNVYKTYTCWVDTESKFIMEHEVKK